MPHFTRAAMRQHSRDLAATLVVFVSIASAHAQPNTTGDAVDALPPVVVTGTRLERPLSDTPGGASVVDETALRAARQGLQLDEALTRVPGLFLQNRYNFAQGQRLSIRGFGARAPFGVRGIRVLVDGFPETLPDGQSQIDSVDLDSATRVEVLRGPSSVLYGNASGGVVSVTTADGRDDPSPLALRLQTGSDGFRKLGLRTGGTQGDLNYHLSLNHLDYDGYRQQSQVRRTLLNARAGWQIAPDQRLETVFTALDLPTAEDPGGLTRADAADDRRQALAIARSLDAGQDVDQQRLGLRYIHEAAGTGELRVQGFYSQRDFAQRLPFFFPGAENFVAFERDFFGGGAEYRSRGVMAGYDWRGVAGIDAQRQRDDRLRRRLTPDGELSEPTEMQDQQATVLAAFGQIDIDLIDALTLSLGVRGDRLRLSTEDRLGEGEDNASGARTFNETSYSIGLVHRLAGGHRVYANVATAFEAPTFTEFAQPDGGAGFNPGLSPQDTRNREIGLRNGLGGPLHYDLSLFSVRVDDEIFPFERDGRTFFENAAKTDRDGVESSLVWRVTDTVAITGSYTYARYRFAQFTDRDGSDRSGNRIPGLPRHTGFLETRWQSNSGLFAAADALAIGNVSANNANSETVAGYTVVNARGGYTHALRGDASLTWFGGINNLLDHDYFANIRVNANGGRFFEPAPERHFYAGLELRL